MVTLAHNHGLADLIADVLILVDKDARIAAANALALEALGQDLVGQPLETAFGKSGADALRTVLAAAVDQPQELEAPLATPSGPVGYLWVLSPAPDGAVAMCGREIDRIYGLDLIGRLTQDLQDRQGRLEVVTQINRALARTLELDEIDLVVAREAPSLLPLDFLQIVVAGSSIELADGRVFTPGGQVVTTLESRPWAGLSAARCFKERRYRIHSGAKAIGAPLDALGAMSALDMPIILDDQVLGVMTFASREAAAYQVADVQAVAPVVGQYAVALVNARLVRGLTEANRIKQEIIEIASHELNTPLTVIKGFAALLAAGDLEGDQAHDAIRMIDVEAERLRRLVDELLTVSRIDAGRIDLYLSDVDLAQLIDDACRAMTMAYPDRKIDMFVSDSVTLVQDGNKLVRCVTNLLSNALKFSPKETVVTITLEPCQQGWAIRVFNVNEGLSEEEIAQLFQKFRRLERFKNLAEGTGLGLYMTRKLAQRLGGDVLVDSVLGRGTTFTLVVPDLSESLPD